MASWSDLVELLDIAGRQYVDMSTKTKSSSLLHEDSLNNRNSLLRISSVVPMAACVAVAYQCKKEQDVIDLYLELAP